MYGSYQTTVYYITLIAQEINKLSPSAAAIRIIPMGLVGGVLSVAIGPAVSRFNTKYLPLVRMALCVIAPLPCCFMSPGGISFWKHVFPTSVIGVAGVAITYCTVSIFILSSVPVNIKSLCSGIVNSVPDWAGCWAGAVERCRRGGGCQKGTRGAKAIRDGFMVLCWPCQRWFCGKCGRSEESRPCKRRGHGDTLKYQTSLSLCTSFLALSMRKHTIAI